MSDSMEQFTILESDEYLTILFGGETVFFRKSSQHYGHVLEALQEKNSVKLLSLVAYELGASEVFGDMLEKITFLKFLHRQHGYADAVTFVRDQIAAMSKDERDALSRELRQLM